MTTTANTTLTTKHPEYELALQRWVLVQDCIDGSQAVKLKAKIYLPMPNADDDSPENVTRYKQYLIRALFYNATQRTLTGMIGSVFRKPSIATLSNKLMYLEENVDNGGLTLDQQARETVGAVLSKGRHGLLVDMPTKYEITESEVDGQTVVSTEAVYQLSQQDVEDGFRATIQTYNADNILDWGELKTGGKCVLNYVKLDESQSVLDPVSHLRQDVCITRILALDVNGNYYQEVWVNNELKEIVYPTAGGGNLKYIPFIFCGAENNKPSIDNAPLYDLAIVNVAHYRNSADFEESCFIVGQPTLFISSGYDPKDMQEANKNGIQMGSRTGHNLGEGGTAILLQADPNNLPNEAMKDKQQLMVSLGAQIVTDNTTEITATATNTDNETSTSALALVVGNVSEAYTKCLSWVAEFMGGAGENSLLLNTEFFPIVMSSEDMKAWAELVQMGLLPDALFYERMRQSKNIPEDVTDEDIKNAITESEFGIDLTTPPIISEDNTDENNGGDDGDNKQDGE